MVLKWEMWYTLDDNLIAYVTPLSITVSFFALSSTGCSCGSVPMQVWLKASGKGDLENTKTWGRRVKCIPHLS